MNVLLLAPYDLFPPVHGGSSIAYNFVKHASARHDVSALISHLYSLGGQINLDDNVHITYCRRSVFDRLRVLSFLVNPHYYRAAARICRERHPDVIHCQTLWPVLAGWYLRCRYRVPLVCVEENVEALKSAELARPGIVTRLVRIIEAFACRRVDHIITLSEVDRTALIEMYNAQPERISVINPGPDLADFRFDAGRRAAVRRHYGLSDSDALLTFVGNLAYEPNARAVRCIAEYIYPAVINEHPSAQFAIIGQGSERLADRRRDNITFTGYVTREDLVAHLSATDIFLVPVETGSGIRIKIPEATACGRAVVSTKKAAAGLEFFDDDEIIRVPGVGQQFVSAVLRLIEDETLRNTLGARAEARTRRRFGWDRALAAFEEAYAKAIAAASGVHKLT